VRRRVEEEQPVSDETRLVRSLAALLVLVASACSGVNAPASPLATPFQGATAAPVATPAPVATAAATPKPTVAPPPATPLPIGRVVATTLRNSPEGDFQGVFTLGTDGQQTPVSVPTAAEWFNGIWSPDGRQLLVNAFDGTSLHLGRLDVATLAWTEVRPKGMVGELECTDWTPDATHVICSRGGPDPAMDGIYLLDLQSGAAKLLRKSEYHHVTGTSGECGGGEGRAVFSPDGKQFAFEQQRCGDGPDPGATEEGSIAVADADGSNVKVIVRFGDVRTHAGGEIAWSPVDDRIAYASQDGVLRIVRSDGSGNVAPPIPAPGFVYGPTWSPDGKWLLISFIPQATGVDNLYVVAPDGSSLRQLTSSPLVEAFTDWGVAP
jgi:WD40 repeat protein